MGLGLDPVVMNNKERTVHDKSNEVIREGNPMQSIFKA